MSKRSIITDRKKSAVNKHWSARDRVRAVAAYLVSSNMARVSEETGIPLGTLNYWKTQPWWFEQVEKIRQEEDSEIDTSFTKIVKKTQEIMLDRLENGDFYVDKDGRVMRKPVSVRDAAIVGAIGIDKRNILRSNQTTGESKVGMQERLKNLEVQFTKLVDREIRTIDITPVKVEEANGEEELPEGIRSRIEGAPGGESTTESGSESHDQRGEGESGGWEGRGPQKSHLEGGKEHLSELRDTGPLEKSFFRPS